MALSEFTAHAANAIAPFVTVVTAGQAGEVSLANAAQAPEPLKATSCGVVVFTPDNDPIHHPTCSAVPAEVNV